MALTPHEQTQSSTGTDIQLGRFKFRVLYRVAGDDQGITIHVFGPRSGTQEEVLRFDCFRNTPHYHLGWSYRNEPFIRINDSDPFQWAIRKIQSEFDPLLHAADADPLHSDEAAGLTEAANQILRLGEAAEREAQ